MSVVNFVCFIVLASCVVISGVNSQSAGNSTIDSVPLTPSGTVFNVTVVLRTSLDQLFPPGTPNAFVAVFALNGIQGAAIKVVRGSIIGFQLQNVAVHMFYITTNPQGAGSGSVIGNSSYTGNQLFQYTVDPLGNGTTTLYYSCRISTHFFMTGTIFVVPNTATSAVVGDPQFLGLRGQRFQIHGIDGAVYNIISDSTLQMNARFQFLSGPHSCPVLPSTNRKATACWSHDGSYLSEIGILTSSGAVYIEAGAASFGFKTVAFNMRSVAVGSTVNYLSLNSTHELTLNLDKFNIQIENIDGFVNLRSVAVNHLNDLRSHGLLGQTWNTKKYDGPVPEIEGDVDDYVISEGNVFGSSFMYNRFSADPIEIHG